jgi:riboflavin kinase/FMN adenylyltransferase
MQPGCVVSIGTFDGVHLGHQAILRELAQQAKTRGLPAVVYAFAAPPRWVLSANEDRYLLLPISVKLDLLRSFIGRVQPAAFETIRTLGPREFVDSILVDQLNARVIVEGESFRFGRDRAGDLDTLRSLGHKRGLDVVSVPPQQVDGHAVSSTRIRDALIAGDIATAQRCLGRPAILLGTVLRGDHFGTAIGYPTANLAIDPHVLLPAPGIYLVRAFGKDLASDGLLYVGTRPTLEHSLLRCEVHLMDFPPRPLYDELLEVHLLAPIRDDRKFESLEALGAQIGRDVASARQLLAHLSYRGDRISS